MPDEVDTKPKAPGVDDYIQAINKTVARMRWDADVHDKSFAPSYNYNSSSFKQVFDSLPQGPGLPADIAQQVKGLEGGFKDTVSAIMKKDFNETTFKAPLEALQTSITAANPNKDNADLNKLAEAIKNIQQDALLNEMKHIERALHLQSEINRSNAFTDYAIKNGPYQNARSFYANDWVNQSQNDRYSEEELGQLSNAGVALSSQGPLHNGADGIYTRPDSKYTVQKLTDENGYASYNANYSNVPKGIPRQLGEDLIQTAVTLVRFYATITLIIPAIQLVAAGISLIASGGKSSGPPGGHFGDIFRFDNHIFDQRRGNIRDEVRAEINVARNIGKENGIVFDARSSQKSEMNQPDLEKLTVYIDEIKKRGGFVPGDPPKMTKPQQAMGFQLSQNAESKLQALTSDTDLTRETMKMVKSFYKSQNGGSMKGFEEAKFKEYILKEISALKAAYAPLRGPGQDQVQSSTISPGGNANTSVITPTGNAATSIISPSAATATSVISPSAATATSVISPSAPPPEETPQRKAAAEKLIAAAAAGGVTLKEGNLHDVVTEAINKLDDYKDQSNDWIGVELKQNIDVAIKEMPQSEIKEMEALGELNNYRDFCDDVGPKPDPKIAAEPRAAQAAVGRMKPLEGKQPAGAGPEPKADEPAPSTVRPK
jgi:hypothetical protein